VIVAHSSLIGFSAHELFDLARRRRVGTRVIADDLGTELGVGRQVGNIETVACFRINARLKRGAGRQLRKNPLADLRRCYFVLGAHQAQCRHLGPPWLKVSAIGVIGDDGPQWTVLCRGQLTECREHRTAPERPADRGNLRCLARWRFLPAFSDFLLEALPAATNRKMRFTGNVVEGTARSAIVWAGTREPRNTGSQPMILPKPDDGAVSYSNFRLYWSLLTGRMLLLTVNGIDQITRELSQTDMRS
jgi:hypothetical protein